MQIGIIGLGIMGGSLAKAIKKYTLHTVCGYDTNPEVCKLAKLEGAIDTVGDIQNCHVVFVCLYPNDAIKYIKETTFLKNAIVADICGVKEVLECLNDVANIYYVGTHPMAGREISGYSSCEADLFVGASFIITINEYTNKNAVKVLETIVQNIGFARITKCSAAKHDKVIAYTSQLAHIVSNSYVKSNSAKEFSGFSAGSFLDLTRVARLNPVMWTELFLENSSHIINEIDTLIANLNDIKTTLANKDEQTLYALLKNGSDIKKEIDNSVI